MMAIYIRSGTPNLSAIDAAMRVWFSSIPDIQFLYYFNQKRAKPAAP